MAKNLNNIALCYHGMTSNKDEKSNYITYIEDFKGQINHLEALGYKFVKPSDFYKQYTKLSKPIPIATIIFDDALESVSIATIWLAEKSIPFGIAIIGQRLRKLTPEAGYASWKDINMAIESGLCEVLHHTYNMHHFCLKKEGKEILSSPILEGPWFKDHGDFIYMEDGDTRKYFDMSHVNQTAWGFPLFGTDNNTDKAINSVVRFKANTDITVDRMRLWACLHNPYGNGYNAKVQILMNDSIVADIVIKPTKYGVITQWPEREFITIPFKNKYDIKKGSNYEIKFITQNTGNAAFMIYAIPDFTGDFKLTTSCTAMTFPEDIQWPARACIVLADGTGKSVSEGDYAAYVKDDLNQNNQVITKYLNATWNTRSTGYKEADLLSTIVLGGTYSNGELASTKIFFHAEESFTTEILRFKYAGRLGIEYPLIMDIFINDRKVGSFEASWWDWHWQEVEVNSFNFAARKDYVIRFETKNANPHGQGLVRIYMQQPKSPQPIWNSELNRIVVPPDTDFEHEILYEVSNPEGSDVFPDGAVISKDTNFKWLFYEPYDGPGKVFLEMLSCTSGKVVTPKQICYPFGSYYASSVTSKLLPEKEDIQPVLKGVLTGVGIKSGYSVWDDPVSSLKNINLKYSEYIIPRYLIEGSTNQTQVIKNLDKFIGYK